jgi:hypothetical protein
MHLRFVRLLAFHFSSGKRETIDIVHGIREILICKKRTLGYKKRTLGYLACLERLGP